jgi:hypothetical protein
MPGKKNPGLKDPELHEGLRKDGAPKQKAARLSNVAAQRGRPAVGGKGRKSGDHEDWSESISALRNS